MPRMKARDLIAATISYWAVALFLSGMAIFMIGHCPVEISAEQCVATVARVRRNALGLSVLGYLIFMIMLVRQGRSR